MNRRNLLIRAGALGAAAGGAWWLREHVFWPAPEAAFGAAGSTPWLAFARPIPLPTARTVIDGVEVVALIDSGAQYSLIDRALFRRLGRPSTLALPMMAMGLGGRAQIGRGVRLDLALPGLAIGGLHAAILDFGALAGGGDGPATPLILGQDLLRRLVLELDPENRRLRLVGRAAFVPDAGLVARPVRRRGGLTARVTVEGAAVEAVIDTGAAALLTLNRSAATSTGLLDGRESRAASSLVLGGVMAARMVQARTVTFAGQIYRRAAVGVYDQPPLPHFPAALIGMAAFEARRAALDLGGGTLHVSRTLDLTIGQDPPET